MNNFTIRLAREDKDEKAILKLIKEAFHEDDLKHAKRYYDKFFEDDEMTYEDEVFVAEADNQIVGVAGYSCDYFSTDHSYWLGWFVVAKKFRRRKIGSDLLEKVESELKKYKVKKLFVSTDDKNGSAIQFYIENRFSFEARLRDYYCAGEDQIILGKNL